MRTGQLVQVIPGESAPNYVFLSTIWLQERVKVGKKIHRPTFLVSLVLLYFAHSDPFF